MKRNIGIVIILLLGLLLLSCAAQKPIPENVRIVRLNIPTCDWPGTAARIRLILENIDGVYKADADYHDSSVKVFFDDKKASVDQFIKALSKGGFEITGSPKFLN
jgi:copper chaperone CopZ